MGDSFGATHVRVAEAWREALRDEREEEADEFEALFCHVHELLSYVITEPCHSYLILSSS